MKKFLLFFFVLIAILHINAQSIVNEILKGNPPSSSSAEVIGCGHFSLMEAKNQQIVNYIESMDQQMLQIKKNIAHQKEMRSFGEDEVVKIQMVFHVVYNNEDENIPDSVLYNQVKILNESFRRTNADTVNTRSEFRNLVGDSKIEFELAQKDPAGNPSNGIVRHSTNVEYFGGILPYAAHQQQEIVDWITDSLYYNLFRITKDGLGGSDAWDTDRYFNVWIGDLRIFEPKFNNFEELVFFALGTPPMEKMLHWPDSVMEVFKDFEQGVLIHYPIVGGNNPNLLPPPYQPYNNLVKSGKVLVHEAGHYLGLRHIWGDGDCSFDDFIDDTPNANSDSQWACNHNRNTCVDDIFGLDLPDMVENYMDYSNGACQNSFTKGQIEMMRYILAQYRGNTLGLERSTLSSDFNLYPNPTSQKVYLQSPAVSSLLKVYIYNPLGQLIYKEEHKNMDIITLDLEGEKGLYLVKVLSKGQQTTFKVLKH